MGTFARRSCPSGIWQCVRCPTASLLRPTFGSRLKWHRACATHPERTCGNRACSEIVNGPRNKQYHERTCGDREKYLRHLDRKAEASATKGT